MTPQEKAQELFGKYSNVALLDNYEAKQCALIAVDEILEMDLPILEEDTDGFYDFWNEVKHELNKSK